jgi:hypothetical protein
MQAIRILTLTTALFTGAAVAADSAQAACVIESPPFGAGLQQDTFQSFNIQRDRKIWLMTPQVYGSTVREARQGTRQAGTPRPSQAKFLRRVETYRNNWQRTLKGILAGFHQHRGVEATAALYAQLCEQHRQLSSPRQWVKHFPLPHWRF